MSRLLRRALPRLDGLPRAYWALWLATLVDKVGGFVIPFLAVYLTEQRRLSPARAGAIIALFGAGSIAAAPIGGALADRIGRKRTMVLALLLGASAMLHLGFARAPAHIAIATFMLGFLGQMFRPASQALVADLVAPEDRARAYALQYWAVNLGFAIGPALAGVLASDNFTLLFVGDAATTVACAIIVAIFVSSPSAPTSAASASEPKLDYLAPYRDAPFVLFLLLALLVAIVFQQSFITLPIQMRARGLDAATFGGLIAINGVLIVLVQPFVIGPIQHVRRERALALGALLTGAGFGANAFATTPFDFAIGIVLFTLGEIATVPVLSSVVAELAPPHLRGSYQGAYQLAWSGASLGAPALGSLVYDRFGGPVLWSSCFVVGVLSALAYLAIGGSLRRRAAIAIAAST